MKVQVQDTRIGKGTLGNEVRHNLIHTQEIPSHESRIFKGRGHTSTRIAVKRMVITYLSQEAHQAKG